MLKIVNNTVPLALNTLGYDQPQIESILAYIEKARHDRRRARFEAGAPERVRLCVQTAQRHTLDSPGMPTSR